MEDSTLQTVSLWLGIISAALTILGFAWRNRGVMVNGLIAVAAFAVIGGMIYYAKHTGRVLNRVGEVVSLEHPTAVTTGIVAVGALFLLLAVLAVLRRRRGATRLR